MIALGALVPLGACAAYTYTIDPSLGIGLAIGSIAGVVMTPDIDHHVRTREETIFYNVSPSLGRLYESFWSPFRILVGRRHRGTTHVPIWGTTLRYLYLAFGIQMIFYVVLGVLNDFGLEEAFVSVQSLEEAFRLFFFSIVGLGILIGWACQDLVHILSDLIAS